MPNPTDLLAIVQELVALKDLKARMRDLEDRMCTLQESDEFDQLENDYVRRKPLAWAAARAALSAPDEAPICLSCGEPQSRNPHPKAGDPSLEFGYMFHCIPCLVRTRSSAIRRAWAAEKALREMLEATPNPPVNAAAQEALAPDGNAALDKSASAPGNAPKAPPVAAAPNTQEPER